MNQIQRQQLTQVFQHAIATVAGEQCVSTWLQQHPIKGSVYVIAIGKAGVSMMQGAMAELGAQIEKGLVITKSKHCAKLDSHISCLESAHPVPDENSLNAGSQLLHFIQDIPLQAHVLVLISGGASALVEVLPEAVTLEDWRNINDWLLAHAFPIEQINYVRKRVSCIKGGRLAQYFAERRVNCLLISDVQGDDPGTIGSGLLVPDRTQAGPWLNKLPAAFTAMLQQSPQIPAENDTCFRSIVVDVIASLKEAKTAAQAQGETLGLPVMLHEEFIDGDAIQVGKSLAQQLRQGPSGLHIWGGETTVQLPPHPGRGGRSQSLALAAATVIAGHDDVFLLAAGTDGTDGPGEDAGALVDGGTLERAKQKLNSSRDAEYYLNNADAGRFLAASGDLIRTGPTGTNVMDLILGLKL